jgi:hypothetical protein
MFSKPGERGRGEQKAMRSKCSKVSALVLLFAATYFTRPGTADAQAVSLTEASIHSKGSSAGDVCAETAASSAEKKALRLVCLRDRGAMPSITVRSAIVIGFVGGFVRRDDPTHPEVQFAAYLRNRYPSAIHAEVFANHEGKDALRQVLHLLNTNGDGGLTASEKEQASIIIYGHSWGASQAVTLARELGRQGIPVLLTVQVDSIPKLRQDDSTIPSNVRTAVNFYQPKGLIHGRSVIRAADPARTKILGNFRMTYQGHRINCRNHRWISRVFNKSHLEIENDPHVWEQIASLIDSELSGTASTAEASSHWQFVP